MWILADLSVGVQEVLRGTQQFFDPFIVEEFPQKHVTDKAFCEEISKHLHVKERERTALDLHTSQILCGSVPGAAAL